MTLWIQQFPILSNQVERDSAVIIRKVPAANNATIVVLVEPLTAEAITQSDEIAQLLITELQQSLIDQNRGRTFAIETAIQNIQHRLTTNTQNKKFEDKPIVAIACIEILEDQAIIGLVGTTHCFLRDGNELFSLTTDGHAATAPIGATNTPAAVRFFNTNLKDQELVLTTSTTRFDETLEEILTTRNSVETTWANIVDYVREIPHASAVFLTWQSNQSEHKQDSLERSPNDFVTTGELTSPSKLIKLKILFRRPIRRIKKNWKAIFLALVLFIGSVPLLINMYGAGRIDFWNQYDEVVLEIQTFSREALINSDKSDALDETESYLTSALVQIRTGLSITPNSKELRQLEAEVRQRLNTLKISEEVTSLQTLTTFYKGDDTPNEMTRIVLGGGLLWAIDQSNGWIVRSNPEKTDYTNVIYRQGDTYQGTPADSPLSITWDELRDRLIILDTNGTFFTYEAIDDGLPRPLGLPRTMPANQILDITASENLLLAVDSGGLLSLYKLERNALRPSNGILYSKPIPNLVSIDLDEFGNPVLLTGTDLISFRIDNEILLKSKPTPSIKLATALTTDPKHMFTYVGEPKQRRILVVNTEHTLIGIYRHPTFDKIIDIASDDKAIYLLTKSEILRFLKTFDQK